MKTLPQTGRHGCVRNGRHRTDFDTIFESNSKRLSENALNSLDFYKKFENNLKKFLLIFYDADQSMTVQKTVTRHLKCWVMIFEGCHFGILGVDMNYEP